MEELSSLLMEIEGALESRPVSLREGAIHEAERMYTHHALAICMSKLRGEAADEGRDGILRAKAMFERIAKAEF